MANPRKTPLDLLQDACSRKKIEIVSPPSALAGGLMKSKVDLRCLACGHRWNVLAGNVTRKPPKDSGCPACARLSQASKLLGRGEERVRALAAELGYELLSPYGGHFERIRFKCGACLAEFSVAPNNLLDGQRCPSCSGRPQWGEPAQVVAGATAGSTWELVSGVPERGGRARFSCSACGAGKELSWDGMTQAAREPADYRKCDCRRYGEPYEAYVASVPGYSLLEPYRGKGVAIRHRHDVCGEEWPCIPYNFQKANGSERPPTRCPRCSRAGRASSGQLGLAEFVRSLGLDVRENIPGLEAAIPRSEVDVLVETAAGLVAIDFDGVWWHAEGGARDERLPPRRTCLPGAALAKAEALAAREPRVRLVRIYSDEWALRRPAVESRLRAILGRPLRAVGARQLRVDPAPDPAAVRALLAAAHTQGAPALQTYAVALCSESGIEAAMTFGERTLGSAAGKQLELLRYCCAPGLSVRGGAGRLLRAFLGTHPELDGARIVTYADLRWTPVWGSAMYESIGFRPEGRAKPTYDYVHPSQSNRRVSRIALQKHKLLAANPQFDASMTEEQMASALGYARVWNSGSLRYALGG